MTRRFALFGDPVSHSISPQIHAAAFGAWGLAAQYDRRRVAVSGFEAAIRDRTLEGGNITLPHKVRAAELLDRRSPDVIATGACNCWWWEQGELAGDNTDVGGFAAAVRELVPDLGGTRVLLLGAGGAARAAIRALAIEGVERIDIGNRDVERAVRLASESAEPGVVALSGGDPATRYDLIVNATSLGLQPNDPLPLDLRGREAPVIYDMVYGRGETAWVRHARSLGVVAQDGLGMLVHQAALSLRRWIPEREPPLDAMREAAEREIGRG